MTSAKLRLSRDVSDLHPTRNKNILLFQDLVGLNALLLTQLDERELAFQLADLIGGFWICSRGNLSPPPHISCGRQTYSMVPTGDPAL